MKCKARFRGKCAFFLSDVSPVRVKKGHKKEVDNATIWMYNTGVHKEEIFSRRERMLDRFSRFSLAISEIDRCWHKLATDEMAKYGLNSPHAVYLNTLYEYNEGITAAKLGELCCKNKADVSRMVSILEKKGLVKKESVGGSLYRAKLLLTQEGRNAAQQVRKQAALVVELAGTGMTDQEREIFYRCLEKITGNLKTLCKNGLPTNE